MGCIYAFFFKDSGECVYVGSTQNFWIRYSTHIKEYYAKRKMHKLYSIIAEKGGWDNIDWRILENNIENNSILIREKHYYLELKPSGNSCSPLRTQEEKAQQMKKKRNRKQKTKIVCDCGVSIQYYYLEKHILTQKHQNWASSFP